MSLVINHNLMALNAARNLDNSYNALSTSTKRLSSGLRINSAADDAAGLAIRELMRSDVSTMNQGIRNANDAISMIQTADGAMQVIDEKLIRMNELAEQASTGTYTSDQRLIIVSEYQAMASEITRIASATDFNGIYLLNGNLDSQFHDGSGLNPSGKMKIHFGTGNSSAEDYYYIQIGNCTAAALGVGNGNTISNGVERSEDTMKNFAFNYAISLGFTKSEADALADGYNGAFSSEISYSLNHDNHQSPVDYQNTNWTDLSLLDQTKLQYQWAMDTSKKLAAGNITGATTTDPGVIAGSFDGKATATGVDFSGKSITASDFDVAVAKSAGEAYNTSWSGNNIQTQEDAQSALAALHTAIVSKDKIRANLGSVQNRLENTISNLEIQVENLMAAESQISDVDVASEMTEYVRQQILTQSATAMLAQANSFPKMALQLISGQ